MALRLFHLPHRLGSSRESSPTAAATPYRSLLLQAERLPPIVHHSSSSARCHGRVPCRTDHTLKMTMKCRLRMSVSNLQTSDGETSDCVSSIRGGAMAADGETSDSRSSIRQGATGAKDEETSSCNAGIKEQRPVVVVPVVSENTISRTATILAGSLLLFLSLGLSKVAPAFARKVASPPSTTTTTTASLLQEEEEAQNQGKSSPLSNLTETETSSSDVGVSQQNPTPDKEKVPEFQTDPAELVLLKFLERHPEDLKALEGLMYVRLRKGDVKAALKILEKLLELRPAHLPWQLIRAQSLDFVGDLDEARQAFQAILEKNPLSARALQGLAIVMSKTGEEKESLEMLKKAVDAALKAERPKEAINVRMLLAQMHTMQGNLKEALDEYQDVVKVDPTDFRPYLCQGLVYSILGKTEEAEKQFSKYRQLCPNTFPNRGYLDDLLLNAKTMARRIESRKGKKPAPGKRPMKPMRQPTAVGVGPPPDSE
ncbi:unnamed protein product [Sphagnum balticum]